MVVILISSLVLAILTLLVGIVVLIWPKSLNVAVAIWLILSGILQLLAIYG